MITTIIEEMTKGNFSFLILIVGILQLFVMVKGKIKFKRRKGKDMTPQVYENLEQLTYKELLDALARLKNHLEETEDADNKYYIALIQELDKRQKEM